MKYFLNLEELEVSEEGGSPSGGLNGKKGHCHARSPLSARKVQSCVNTFLLSCENHPQNVPLPTLKMRCNTIFQPSIPET